jgi:hypothetical protein
MGSPKGVDNLTVFSTLQRQGTRGTFNGNGNAASFLALGEDVSGSFYGKAS